MSVARRPTRAPPRAEQLMRGGHRLLGRALRGLDVPDLLLGFDRAALEEGLLFRLELVAKIVQAHGMGIREIAGHQELPNPALVKHRVDDLNRSGVRPS